MKTIIFKNFAELLNNPVSINIGKMESRILELERENELLRLNNQLFAATWQDIREIKKSLPYRFTIFIKNPIKYIRQKDLRKLE